ncbi:MAG TPA: isoprenylcysteine carboxylmethyltransferase family protein [Patescibacteria group bacterium]|nr:isoprenylcysteine carboxylmethyltransferase family protein [Patescibacteria group bacterium]
MSLRNLSLVATLGLMLAVIGLLVRHALFADRVVPVMVQVAAAILMLWARLTLGARSFHASADPTDGKLVTIGPYRFLRHPIYAAILWFTCAGVATHLSWVHVALGALAVLGIATRIYTEERLLAVRYPEYAAYASHTKRILPFVL